MLIYWLLKFIYSKQTINIDRFGSLSKMVRLDHKLKLRVCYVISQYNNTTKERFLQELEEGIILVAKKKEVCKRASA